MQKKYILIAKKFQESEITEHYVYKNLAKSIKDTHNKNILNQIAEDELGHYKFWKALSKEEVKPNKIKVLFYTVLAKCLGLTFVVKLMEKGEEQAQIHYDQFVGKIEHIEQIIEDENRHEGELIDLLKEKKLEYLGSVVLGLNDALVELVGALAGLTLALQNVKLIALTGLIVGIPAAMSMAASEYLSQRSEGGGPDAKVAATYTGIAYITTVAVLVLPFLLMHNPFVALATSVLLALLIIVSFNFYLSVAKGYNFKKRFLEMAALSLGIALLSFGIGRVLKAAFGIDV